MPSCQRGDPDWPRLGCTHDCFDIRLRSYTLAFDIPLPRPSTIRHTATSTYLCFHIPLPAPFAMVPRRLGPLSSHLHFTKSRPLSCKQPSPFIPGIWIPNYSHFFKGFERSEERGGNIRGAQFWSAEIWDRQNS